MDTDEQKQAQLKRKLSEYAMAEDRGVSLLSQMLTFVPGDEEKTFIKGQIEDEKKHNRLFQQRADELNAQEQFFLESLGKLYDIGQECVEQRDWLACVTCQSIIEELALASFASFFPRADEKTKKILLEIMGDEKRHLAFTLWQIEKWARSDEDKTKIHALQKRVIDLFIEALQPDSLNKQIPKSEQDDFKKVLKKTYQLHRQRFSKLKLTVPKIPMAEITRFV